MVFPPTTMFLLKKKPWQQGFFYINNEMNGLHFLPKRMQFHFFINSIRKKRRFGGKWLSQTKLKNLALIKEYYGYSNDKAKSALDILTKDQLKLIKEKLYKGGTK